MNVEQIRRLIRWLNFGLHAVAVVWTDPALSNCPSSIQSSGRPSVVRGYISKLLRCPEGGYDICLSVIKLTLLLPGHFIFTLYQTHVCVCVVLRVLRSVFSCLSLMISAVQYWSIFCPPVSVLRWTQRTLSDHRSPENVTKKLLLQSRSASEETLKKSSGVVFQRVYCVFSSIKSSRWRHRNEPELSAPLVLYSWTSWGVSTGSF